MLEHEGYAELVAQLPEDLLNSLAAGAAQRFQDRQFRAAGTGKDAQVRSSVRSDSICWLGAAALSTTESSLLLYWERLRQVLNQALYLGLNDWEGHYSCYPPGASYQTHLDRFSNDDRRVLSTVLYLNRDWRDGDGGELVLHHEPPCQPVSIKPTWGKVIIFLSAEIPHEVMPTVATRWSIAGWYKRQALFDAAGVKT